MLFPQLPIKLKAVYQTVVAKRKTKRHSQIFRTKNLGELTSARNQGALTPKRSDVACMRNEMVAQGERDRSGLTRSSKTWTNNRLGLAARNPSSEDAKEHSNQFFFYSCTGITPLSGVKDYVQN